jgi:hypothetical protein
MQNSEKQYFKFSCISESLCPKMKHAVGGWGSWTLDQESRCMLSVDKQPMASHLACWADEPGSGELRSSMCYEYEAGHSSPFVLISNPHITLWFFF